MKKTNTQTNQHSVYFRNISALVIIAYLIAYSFTSQAQSADSTKNDNVHIGIVYPLSTHGKDAASYTNALSVHLIAGISKEETAVAVAGFANIVKQNAAGVQAAGFLNHIGSRAKGVTAAGFLNTYTTGDGVQAAGFGNIAGQNVKGLQVAGFINKAADVNGTQVAGFINLSQDIKGSQIGGFANIAKNADGVQLGGFLNKAANTGTQIAGFANIARDVKGVQIAGFINTAANVNGSQIGGFINIAKKVKGVQLAGFMNIADSSDHPIGIVNIIKKGEKSVGVSIDDNATTLLSFRSGGRVLYGIIGAGYNFKNDKEVYALQAGLGAHVINGEYFRLHTELTAIHLDGKNDRGHYFKGSFSVLPALRLGKAIELFGGPNFNFIAANSAEGKELVNHYVWSDKSHNEHYGLYLGYTGGIHFLF